MNALLITFGTVVLFMMVYIFLLLRGQRKEYQIRMEGVREMVKKTKKLRDKRKTQFSEVAVFKELGDEKFESIWLTELEFYQNVGEIICLPSIISIKNLTAYVSRLLKPYYEIYEAIEIPEASEATQAVDSDLTAEIDMLEKRYQEKIEENERLLKKIDELKQHETEEPEPVEDNDDDFTLSAETETTEGGSLEDAIKHILESMAEILDEPSEPLTKITPSSIFEHYQYLQLKLEHKCNTATQGGDDFDQTDALLDQLREEKVAFLKKYKRAMHLLFNTYKEYANAFGLEAPENPEIDIDEFEKFINES